MEKLKQFLASSRSLCFKKAALSHSSLEVNLQSNMLKVSRICDKSVVLLSIHHRPDLDFEQRCSDKNTQWLQGNGFRQAYWVG